MKYFVVASVYSSTDWQDWKQSMSYLGSRENGYEFASENDARAAIIENINDCIRRNEAGIRPEDANSEKIVEMVNSGEAFSVNVAEIPNVGNLVLSYDGDEIYNLATESWYTYDIIYRIMGLEEPFIRYVPVRNYIGWPKCATHAERTVFEYTDTFEKAAAMVMPPYMDKKEGFCGYEDYILIDSYRNLDKSKWYLQQVALQMRIQSLPAELQYKLYSPLPQVQRENLNKCMNMKYQNTKLKELENLCYG